MKNQFKKLLTFIVFQAPLISYASSQYNQLPAELLYNNKPIDSLCIYEAKNNTTPVTLDHCGLKNGQNRQLNDIDTNHTLTELGYVGFNYRGAINKGPTSSRGYSYYKFIGQFNGQIIVLTLNNTGGNGEFSGLYAIKRHKKKTLSETLTSLEGVL